MKSKILLLVLSFCSATVGLLASMEHLQENSPFIPADYKPRGGPARPAAPQPKAPPARKIELSGVIQLGGSYSFSFYEPAKKQSYWVEMNDPKAPIKVIDFNPVAQSVTIQSEAGTEVISMNTSNPSELITEYDNYFSSDGFNTTYKRIRYRISL